MNSVVATVSIVTLCLGSFIAGHWSAMSTARSVVRSNAEMVVLWKASDWRLNVVTYAEILKLIRLDQSPLAVEQACKALTRNLDNLYKVMEIGTLNKDSLDRAARQEDPYGVVQGELSMRLVRHHKNYAALPFWLKRRSQ